MTAVSRSGPAIFGHCERSFIFLANFAKNDEVASRDLKSSETRNVFDFCSISGISVCLISPIHSPWVTMSITTVLHTDCMCGEIMATSKSKTTYIFRESCHKF